MASILDANCYLCKKFRVMKVVSAREFRSNQGRYLNAAMSGQSVMLTSRYGNFKIVPITEDDTLTARVCEGLKEVKKMIDGKFPTKSARDFLNEL